MADYHTPPLIPPFRFNVVESNVFRGGYPKERNLRFMKRLQLKTWISLIPDPPAEHLTTFCEQENINLVHFKVAKPKEGVTLSFSRATRVLQLLVDVDNLPAYIHCLDGTSVTGLVIACLRRLQLWDLRCAMAEYCRFVSPESDEKAFVERFHGDMLIQDRILPAWLWNGGQLALERHPSLPKLRFERVERERETRAQAAKEAKEAAKEAMRRRINAELLRDPNVSHSHEYLSSGSIVRGDDLGIISSGVISSTVGSTNNSNSVGGNMITPATLISSSSPGSGANSVGDSASLAVAGSSNANSSMAAMNAANSTTAGSLNPSSGVNVSSSTISGPGVAADNTVNGQEFRPRRPDSRSLSRTLSSLALEALDID